MKQLMVFIKKELLESLRQYRLFILLTVFIVFGLLSPATAKFMPELLKSLTTEGITITLPPPVYLDSWLQFFKNMSQMGLIVVIILYGGILADEFNKNTIELLRTKGLSSFSIVAGKFIGAALVLGLSYLIGFLVSVIYAAIYFEGALSGEIIAGVFALLLFYLLLVAFFIFFATWIRKLVGVMLASGLSIMLLFLLNIKESFAKFNPVSLLSLGGVLAGDSGVADYTGAFVITLVLIAVLLIAGVLILEKRDL